MRQALPFFTTVIILLLAACGGSEKNRTNSVLVDVDEFKSYELSLEGPHAYFTDFVNNVEIMRLEETEESLLSSVSTFLEQEQEYFVGGYTSKGMKFYRFSKQGKFIGTFDRSGEGPEEYGKYPSTLWFEDGVLFVHMKYEKRIKQYRLNGDFVKEIEIPQVTDHVAPFEGGYAMDMNHAMLEDSLKYDVFTYDKSFQLKDLHIPYAEGYDGFSMSSDDNGFMPYENGLTYIRTMSDSLFFLDDQGAQPLAKFDFGSSWYWNSGAKKPEFGAPVEGPPEEGVPAIVSSMAVFTHPEWFYITCSSNQWGGRPILLDRKTGKYNWMDLKFPEGEKYFLSVIRREEGRLLVSMSSDVIELFLNQLEEEQYSFVSGTTLENIESSENPVMMWVTFKDKWSE